MKKCSKCGAECSDDANFCGQCQTPLGDNTKGNAHGVVMSVGISDNVLCTVYDDDTLEIKSVKLNEIICSRPVSDVIMCCIKRGLMGNSFIIQFGGPDLKLQFSGLSADKAQKLIEYVNDSEAGREDRRKKVELQRAEQKRREAMHRDARSVVMSGHIDNNILYIVYDDDTLDIKNIELNEVLCSGPVSDVILCCIESSFMNNKFILQFCGQDLFTLQFGISLENTLFDNIFVSEAQKLIEYVNDSEAGREDRRKKVELQRAEQKRHEAMHRAALVESQRREAEERAARARREAEERAAQKKRRAEELAAQAKREAAAKAAKERRAKMASAVSEAIESSDGEQKALLSALYLIYENLKDINARIAQADPADVAKMHATSKKKVRDIAFDNAYDIAQEHIKNRRVHEARDVLKRLKDEYEPDYDVLYHLAIVYLDMHRKEHGIETINEAMALQERDPRAYKVLAMIYQDQDVNKALAEIDEAIYLDPSDPQSHIVRAEIMMRGEEPQGVLESCNRAIGLAPNLPDPYVMICKVAKFIKDEKLYKETLDKLEKVDSRAADHVKQLFYKSLTQQLGETLDAIEDGAWKLAGPSIRMQNIGNMFGAAFRRD